MNEPFGRKIVERPELLQAVAAARHAGHTIVHCHGCFDIVHPGHLRYLEFARRQGDLLIVSVTGDNQIDKGNLRPFIPQELRAENLAALEFVDWVYVNPYPTAEAILADVRPDFYVKGREYERSDDPGFLAERRVVEAHGGRVLFSSGEVVFSSTRLLEAIGQRHDLASRRLAYLCSRHEVNAARIDAILSGMRDRRLLVIGDAILDRYVFCDEAEAAHEAPMLSLKALEEQEYVGGAAIVARHAAALGASTMLLTAGGDDDGSRRVRTTLEREGVDLVMLPVRTSTPCTMRYVVDDSKVLRVERGDYTPLDPNGQRDAMAELTQRIDDVDAVLWCDYGYGMITSRLLERALPLIRAKGRIIAADASGPRGNLLAFAGADLLCPTERELRTAWHDFEQGLSKLAWETLNRTGARHLTVTLGKRGVVAFDRQSQDPARPEYRGRLLSEQLPSLGERTVDALGCGDAFLATATLALTAGANLMQAAYVGSAAAALELAATGNVPIGACELRRWLDARVELYATESPGRAAAGSSRRAAPVRVSPGLSAERTLSALREASIPRTVREHQNADR